MGKVIPFITGAAIGALAALAFAPQAGDKTRALVAEKANAFMGEAKDFGAGMPGAAQDAIATARDKGSELLKGASGQAQADTNDELREKIEAARRRIAAQVMENAEQSKAVEVDAEAAEEAAEAAEEAE